MANYSAAFGYDVYILPLASSEVDIAFTGITSPTGTSAATAFLKTDTTSAGDGLNIAAGNSTVSYSNGIFTVEGTTYGMDGADGPLRLYGLTNAALETDTSSEDVITYDDETKGFNTAIATSKSWSMTLEGVADFKDAGYQVLRLTEQNTVADSLRVKVVRIGPTGTVEAVYGYGTLEGYSESIEAGSIVSWKATIQGYGPYRIDPDFNV